MVRNVGPSIGSASDDSATSYDGSASDDCAATIITDASAILVVGIAGAAIVPADNGPSSNHRSATIDGRSAVNCGASVNRPASVAAASGPDLHKLTVILQNREDTLGSGQGRTDRRKRKEHDACDDPKE